MNHLSIVWIRRALALCPLLVLSASAPGCVSHILGGGDGGGGSAGSAIENGGAAGSGGSVSTTSAAVHICADVLMCHGTAVDPSTDRLNCGACDNACGPGEGCASGACVPLGGSCLTCGEVVMPDAANDPMCAYLSESIYDALYACVCGTTCGAVCGDNACVCLQGSPACIDCVTQTGCAAEFQACSNDI